MKSRKRKLYRRFHRGLFTQGRNYGKKCYTSDIRPTCQLYGKYGHFVTDCWHMFDGSFIPHNSQSNLYGSLSIKKSLKIKD